MVTVRVWEQDGFGYIDFGRRSQVHAYDVNQAWVMIDTFLKLGRLVHDKGASPASLLPDRSSKQVLIKMHQLHVCVNWGTDDQILAFTADELFNIADTMTQAAYKVERDIRGLLPSKQDVNDMEEVLITDRHKVIQQAFKNIERPNVNELQVSTPHSFLSKLIRKPWR